MSLHKYWILLTLSLSIAACGGGLSGEYGEGKGADWEPVMSFKGGEVEISYLGQTKLGTYEIKDDKVHITVAGDTRVFAIDDDGCIIEGVVFDKLCKKP
ncbi:MAG: hypothetical protein VX836_13715 [Pseudomonadota bacterium]|jgi:hypothetical protein|nr:hypothetical protein [Pseudomonadota bacterium]